MGRIKAAGNKSPTTANGYYNTKFSPGAVVNCWDSEGWLGIDEVQIRLLIRSEVPLICQWLKTEKIRHTFIDLLPKKEIDLGRYIFERPTTKCMGILQAGQLVGIIAAGIQQDNYLFPGHEHPQF